MQSGLWTVKVVLAKSVEIIQVQASSVVEASKAAQAAYPAMTAATLAAPGQPVVWP